MDRMVYLVDGVGGLTSPPFDLSVRQKRDYFGRPVIDAIERLRCRMPCVGLATRHLKSLNL
jgi:hypothetical protein